MPNNDQESDTNSDTDEVEQEAEQEEEQEEEQEAEQEESVNSLIANFPHYQESAKKCYDEITSCSICK